MTMWIIGYRKFLLGVVFLIISGALIWHAIDKSTDLIELATVIAAMAAGLGVVIWGNKTDSNNSPTDSSLKVRINE